MSKTFLYLIMTVVVYLVIVKGLVFLSADDKKTDNKKSGSKQYTN